MCTKLYHNRSGFVDCISKKNILVWFFGSQCSSCINISVIFWKTRSVV